MSAVPGDAKDWIWVLQRPCPECGLACADIAVDEVAGRVRRDAEAWAAVLGRDGVRDRPRPDVWSPLEYACHVRDVLGVFDERLRLMLDHDDPTYEAWDQDAEAVASDYPGQDPAAVTVQLREAGTVLADRFAGVTDWTRTGRRSDGASFTVASLARYLLHDVEHHLWDVGAR